MYKKGKATSRTPNATVVLAVTESASTRAMQKSDKFEHEGALQPTTIWEEWKSQLKLWQSAVTVDECPASWAITRCR